MTDTTQTTELDTAIASLKKQADRLGIQYKSNTSVATLQKAIQDKLEGTTAGSDSDAPVSQAATVGGSGKTKEQIIAEATKLVRVVITAMESTKASNLDSEMFSAGNAIVGTISRTIPFGVEWHVEQILLNTIKEKKFQLFTSKRNAQGVEITTARLVPAYSIVYLDPLTQEELDELAAQQLRTRSLEDE